MEETQIAYLDSPLTEDCGGSGGPAAGERAPDALAVRLEDKETVRLFDILRWGGWTLLLFGGHEAPRGTYESLQNLGESVGSKYGALIHTHVVATDDVPSDLGIDPSAVLIDRENFLHDGYGVPRPCLYLTRPDGYVGFRGKMEDGDRLMAYINRVFIPPL